MSGITIGLIAIALMLMAIYFGMHIGIALMFISFLSVWALKSPEIAARMVAAAANDAIQDYLFGVVPLFVLMGLLVSVSGVGRDTFDVAQSLLRKVKGGLGVATVASNAVFAAITGISIASASVFTKVAVPEMMRHGYTPRFAVGVVAGSSVLGMLIPPSLLMIIYGVLSEQSIGRMFMAGILPGIVLALMFCAMIIWMAHKRPHMMFATGHHSLEILELSYREIARKAAPILALVGLVLGGLYSGIFTPTEAGAMGALGALIIALLRKSLNWRSLWRVLVETGHVSVSVLFLVLAASLYSRMLALTGLPAGIASSISQLGLGAYGFLLVYIIIVLLLGCIIDSVSIMLIMLPIVLPIATGFNMDLIWFGVVTVVAVEIGLITPPFGISVYTVKATLNDKRISIQEIFAGAWPFVLCMAVALAVIVAFPWLSTVLARM